MTRLSVCDEKNLYYFLGYGAAYAGGGGGSDDESAYQLPDQPLTPAAGAGDAAVATTPGDLAQRL